MSDLQKKIQDLWADRANLAANDPEAVKTVRTVIDQLDRGVVRVAEIVDGEVAVHEWLRQAILLLFRQRAITTEVVGPFEIADRLPLKTGYVDQGVRALPGAIARWGSHLARGVVLMPSFVNIGAYVGANTMVDTWATVGSCAQIGANVHLSGGVGIGGVLEPPTASPVIIGDDAFIGSRSMITNGARVGQGAVLGAGVILTDTIPVIDAETGEEISRGVVPEWSVAVSATRERRFGGGTFGLPCVLVIKRLEAGRRHDKTQLNEVLRAHGGLGA